MKRPSDNEYREACNALQLWKVRDFVTQESEKTFFKSLENGKCHVKFQLEISNSLVNVNAIGIKNSPLKLVNVSLESLLTNLALSHKKMPKSNEKYIGDLVVSLGKIERKDCFKGLVDLLNVENEKQIEKRQKDYISLAQVTIGSNGKFVPGSLVLSPLVWLLKKASTDKNFSIETVVGLKECFKKDCESAEEKLVKPLLEIDSDDDRSSIAIKDLENVLAALVKELNKNQDHVFEVKEAGHNSFKSNEGNIVSDNKSTISVYKAIFVDVCGYTNEKKREKSQETAPCFWTAYYYDDLEMVQSYLRENGSKDAECDALVRFIVGDQKAVNHFDVLINDGEQLYRFYLEALSPLNSPLGRWPSPFKPALLQQLAINVSAKALQRDDSQSCLIDGIDVPNYFSVNGPPGTGKTTMLKDVIANCVVEKAKILSDFENPDDAFEKISLEDATNNNWNFVKDCYALKGVAKNASRYGVVVCSQNNAAVENISKELPDKRSVSSLTFDTDSNLFLDNDDSNRFFKSYASWLFGFYNEKNKLTPSEDVWGLISAPLGKSKHVNTFRDRVLKSGHLANKTKYQNKDHLIRYQESQKRFKNLCAEIEKIQKTLSQVPEELKQLLDQRKKYTLGINEKRSKEAAAKSDLESLIPEEYLEIYKIEGLEGVFKRIDWARTDELSKGLSIASGSGGLFGKIKECIGNLLASEEERELRNNSVKKFNYLYETRNSLDWAYAKLRSCQQDLIVMQQDLEAIENRIKELQSDKQNAQPLPADIGVLLQEKDVTKRSKAYLSYVWLTDEYDSKREELFAAAFDLTCKFTMASTYLRKNLNLLCDFWGSPDKRMSGDEEAVIAFTDSDRNKAMPILLDSLLIAAPVVSSTFASARSMFKNIKQPASFGMLVIDEAGQAIPSQAIGALFRCRRALIVGDPKQIDPVVTDEMAGIESLFDDSFNSYKNGSEFQPKSVQTAADANNPIGSNLTESGNESKGGLSLQNREYEWVGSPLLVHRRCCSPMFDISNQLSYGGAMSKETKEPSKEKCSQLCLPSSFWFNVRGNEQGGGDHYVENQAQAILRYLQKAFALAGEDEMPSLFLISPFKTVVNGLKGFVRNQSKLEVKEETLRKWCDSHIGTVHTFQGKEADEVIFVLGCDKNALGAARWVKRNIVNVAVTRAKYRFVAVGDEEVWCGEGRNKSVDIMKRILDSWWIDQLPDDKKEQKAMLKERPDLFPRVESLTFFDTLKDSNDLGQDTDGQDELGKELDSDCISLGFFDSISKHDRLLRGLSESDYQNAGFLSKRECGDCCGNDKKLYSIMTWGVWFRSLYDSNETMEVDPGGLLICCYTFFYAAECCLRQRYVPYFKELLPDCKFKNKTLREAHNREFTMGSVKRVLKDNIEKLAQATSKVNSYFNEGWWSNMVKLLDKVSDVRNTALHPAAENVTAEEYLKTIDQAVGKGADDCKGWPRGIIRELQIEEVLKSAVTAANLSKIDGSNNRAQFE